MLSVKDLHWGPRQCKSCKSLIFKHLRRVGPQRNPLCFSDLRRIFFLDKWGLFALTPSVAPSLFSAPNAKPLDAALFNGSGHELDGAPLLLCVAGELEGGGASVLLFGEERFSDIHVAKRILHLAALRGRDGDVAINCDIHFVPFRLLLLLLSLTTGKD